MTPSLEKIASDVIQLCAQKGIMIATAESCTGGLVAGTLTAIAGSSVAVDRGFVTYSNEAKTEMLGVDPGLIAAHGAVSRDVALAMAAGALQLSRAALSVSITGIAGPGGGTADKPVGLVHFAGARLLSRGRESLDFTAVHREERFGDIGRAAVREKSVEVALQLLLALSAEAN